MYASTNWGSSPSSKLGLLIARSHILKTEPRCFLMSLNGLHGQILVKVDPPALASWSKLLNIHKTYKLSELVYCSITFESPDEIVHFWKTTERSAFVELDDVPPHINSWMTTNSFLINYQGIVTREVSSVGIVLLDEKVQLCVFFVLPNIYLHGLCIGQKIQVFNAHLTSRNTLVMCSRSNIVVIGEYSYECAEQAPMEYIVDPSFGYGDYLWLIKQLTVFEGKFSDYFLLQRVDSKQRFQNLRIKALVQLLGLSIHHDSTYMRKKQLFLDFFCNSHPCILYKSVRLRQNVNLLKVQVESFKDLLIQSELNVTSNWTWASSDVSSGNDLVGMLTVSHRDGYWHLSDSTYSVPCITNEFIRSALLHQLVVICHYKVVVEKITCHGTDNGNEDIKVYLLITCDSVTPLIKSTIKHTPTVPLKSLKLTSGCCTLCSISQRHVQDEVRFNSCCEVGQASELTEMEGGTISADWKHVHLVVVHYVATPVKVFRNSVHCFILVSVLQLSSHHSEAGAFPCILVLKDSLLRVIPLLELGVAYYLFFPPNEDVRAFSNAKLNIHLPWSVVELPELTSFSRHICFHSGSWWPLRDRAAQGLYNVEGIVESRIELTPKFDCEFISVNCPGYGEPNLRTLMIVLQDEDKRHTLYLSQWNKRRYPLGLVPGAHICATLLKHATSSSSCNKYFQATDLTAILVLSLPNSNGTIGSSEAWISPSDITLANIGTLENDICGVVESWSILSVVLTAVCGGCKFLRLNGLCQFPGCSAPDECVTFVANASVTIKGMGGRVTLHLKDDNVREMLHLTQQEWSILLSLSQKSELKYNKYYNFEQQKCSNADKIFSLYCMDPILTYHCIYVRCKRFKKSCVGDSYHNPIKSRSLFCIEFKIKSPL